MLFIRITVIFIVLFLTFVKILNVEAEQYNTYARVDEAGEHILFVVDLSNSMTEKIQGTSKYNMLLDTMQQILPQIPPQKHVGLRVYGHHNGFFLPNGACRASSLVVPITQNSTPNIQKQLFAMNPTGCTPITYSLKKAVNSDFVGVKGKKHIILLTDGGENCDESPCDYVMELTKSREDVFIDVIAFNIDDLDANNQLKCTAVVTNGKFYRANTAAELLNSLQSTINAHKEVSGKVLY